MGSRVVRNAEREESDGSYQVTSTEYQVLLGSLLTTR